MLLKRRTSLRTRILAWTFIPTAIILSAVAFTIYYAYQQVTEDLVVGRNQQLTHLSAAQLAADLNSYVDNLNALARTPNFYVASAQSQSSALEAAANQLLAFDGGAIILDPLGTVTAASQSEQEFVGQDWSERSFFRQILRGASAAYSDIIPAAPGHVSILAVAVPIMDSQGQFRGTLAGLFRVGSVSTSAFYGGIVKLRLGENGNTFLVDSTGRVIFHPDRNYIGRDFHNLPDV